MTFLPLSQQRIEAARLLVSQVAEAGSEVSCTWILGDLRPARIFEVAVPTETLAELTEGLTIDVGRDLAQPPR
ncbi:hypothetical protein [Nannocystis radixulma]|uniref:Uncharacterized protein n=1 Tax=Nannocystis radixulma TaxID=2995305 RepID=A0ABT5B3Q9_9BACT|nr:hypothetical protein [Nannocystis radixulma]MDC0667777.1 hypothetical protein [Nannocystis radixulma]